MSDFYNMPQSYAKMQLKLDSIAPYLVVYPNLVEEYFEAMDGLKKKAETLRFSTDVTRQQQTTMSYKTTRITREVRRRNK